MPGVPLSYVTAVPTRSRTLPNLEVPGTSRFANGMADPIPIEDLLPSTVKILVFLPL